MSEKYDYYTLFDWLQFQQFFIQFPRFLILKNKVMQPEQFRLTQFPLANELLINSLIFLSYLAMFVANKKLCCEFIESVFE